MRAVILAAMAAAFGQPAMAVDDYDDCIVLVASDPSGAEREAGEWARFGGGAPARHCYALALIAVGAPLRAADELIGIAQEEPELTDAARADILVQAGELLVDADSPLTAMLVAEEAVRLSKSRPDALGLRAAIHLSEGRVRAALADLNLALERGGPDARLLLRRASAYRRLGDGVAARDDASYAVELLPDRADAWLERGRADAMLRDKPAARTAYLKAIELDRDGRIGRAAQLALQRMETGASE